MPKACCIIVLFSHCFSVPAGLRAQQPIINFERYNLAQGISQGSVQCMTQDHQGSMWFGTQDGLNKFDGYEFTVYRHDTHDRTSISDNNINCIFEDRDNHLWIGTFSGGLNFFDRYRGTFKSFIVEDGRESISSNRATSIVSDINGNLWVGTDNGLNMLNSDSSFVRYFHTPSDTRSISSNDIKVVYLDSKGSLWVGTARGLNRFDPKTKTFTRLAPQGLSENQSAVTAIYEDEKNNFYVGTHGGGLFTFSRAENTFQAVVFDEIQDNSVSTITADPLGNLWIGFREEGVVRWDPRGDASINLRMDPSNPKSLSNDMVYATLCDSFGNLWIGTLDGIDKYNLSNRKFVLFQNKVGIAGHINNSIFAILKDKHGNIWTGTRDGLFRLDITGNLDVFQSDPQKAGTLSDDAIRSIHQDCNGDIWIGTERATVEKFDGKSNSFRKYAVDKTLIENAVYVIREDVNHQFWLGTTNGLYRFDPESGKIDHFDWEKAIKTSTQSKEIRSIEIDNKNNLWIGTRGAGLFYFDQHQRRFTHYQNDPNDPNSLSHNVIASIYIEEEKNTVWLGTASGFNKFDRFENKFQIYSKRDGLPNDVVYGILPDKRGFLWLSTNGGLVRFDPKAEIFRSYDVTDGLQSNEFNAGAYFRGDDGELFFGGINGYNSFYPEKVRDNTLLPQVVLTGFKVFNEPVDLDRSIQFVDEIHLTHNDYVFSLDFSAIHLTAPEKNNYAYKLEGFDPDWVNTKRRFATYTNLDPGKYTFRVRASNNDGVWNENGLKVNIVITPPFWRTWWFFSLVGVVIAGIIYSLYRFRIRQIRKEERLKTEFNKKLADVEMTALRAQMNPHFLFNCLNSINRYIVRSDPETASSYLTKFSRLIRLILQNSKAPTVTLKNELEALRLYIEMEDMRFENKFDYNIHLGKMIEADYVEVPPMLLQPYVENAIWHGLMHKQSRGRLTIAIEQVNGRLKCVIEDNGIGRQRAEQLKSKSATRDKSMGMKITRDRLNLYQTQTQVEIIDLEDDDGNPSGTRVVLAIPYSTEQQELPLHS